MRTLTTRSVALQSLLGGEGDDRGAGLFALHAAQPRTNDRENAFDGRQALGHPFEVVRLAVSLDPSYTDHFVESDQHGRRRTDIAVLIGGDTESMPGLPADSWLASGETEAALAVQKTSGPRPNELGFISR
ncbi:MAG: hypothetical protein HY071_06765 [Chloroflexi bacterium]|nr:hypothetical protein [Chloroflexota bacterium]